MRYNTSNDKNNNCWPITMYTFLKYLISPFLPSNPVHFSFQNQMRFLIHLRDFAVLGLGLSCKQISNSNATRTKNMYAGREG